jgi:hypothetical protein
MTNNKQQTSLDYFLDSFIKNGVSLSPFYLGKFREAKEMYNDEMEAVIIKHCAEIGTSNASAYSDGYKEGYQRALDYMADTIKNKIEIPVHGIVLGNCIGTTGTTNTTFLCTKFISDGTKGATLPRCIKCGKPQYQHPIITNTI